MKRISNLSRKPLFSSVLGGTAVAIFGWLAISVGLIEAPAAEPPVQAAAAAPPASTPIADGDALTAGEVYEQTGPATAYIEADQSDRSSEGSPFPTERGAASGTGFLVDDKGHILTNAHVVDGSESVTVKLGEDGDELDAEVLGSDLSTDVAVLAVDPDKVDAVPMTLADSDEVAVGEAVVAIGNPFGLDHTVTTGIVSAVQREISAPDGQFTISDAIQTDAAINPGNSGGPLINAAGEVVGINSQIATGGGGGGNVGVGFAVPTNTAKDVFSQILEDGSVSHAFIGITGGDVDADIARLLNLDVTEGALVQEVTEGGPADEAGLQGGDATMDIDGRELRVGGDVIIAIEGEPVEGMEDLIGAVNDAEAGEKVELTVQRGAETEQLTVELGERPQG